MNKKPIALILLATLLFFAAKAQVTVNPLNGAAGFNLPIYTVRSGQVAVPVSLSYNGSGIRPKDAEGAGGIGWQLNAGGQISRVVRGLPDDVTKDDAGKQRLGWMSSLDTAATKAATFTTLNNGSTCGYETTDISYINTYFPFRNDAEPDQFYVSAPGLSCSLVFDRDSAKFKPVNYTDIKITYTTIGGTGTTASNIATFTITNDKGINYLFGIPEQVDETSKPPTVGGSPGPYFNRRYNQYINGITYYDSWNLMSITDANGNAVTMYYGDYPLTYGADSVALYLPSSSSYTLQYRTLKLTRPVYLSAIQVGNAYNNKFAINFYWHTLSNAGETGQSVLDSIAGSGRHIQLTYSLVAYTPSGYLRSFLRTFSEPGLTSPVNYTFAYAGEISGPDGYTTILPDSASKQRDYWEYYSSTASTTSRMPKVWMAGPVAGVAPYAIYESNTGSVDTYPYSTTLGNIRAADPANVMAGSLIKITYAAGGNSNIVYESNDYLDVPSGNVVHGGGIRFKQVIDSVGIHSTNNIVRNYAYLNPSTGLSSGKPVTLPQFAFTVPYSGGAAGSTLWNLCTALSAYDLSGEDHTIVYQYSTISQAGAGSTRYQYALPATAWDASAVPICSGCSTPTWIPTSAYVARHDCSVTSYGPISKRMSSYPFIPNPNFDAERGYPVTVSGYDDSGALVSETDYTYAHSYVPLVATGFRAEDDPGGSLVVTSYNSYPVYFNTSELTATEVHKTYDTKGLNTFRSDTTTYTYGSSVHKQVTQVQARNSDKSVMTSLFKYVKDYNAIAGTNPNVTALANLKAQNINAPVESYQQVTRAGVTKTTSAALTLFAGGDAGKHDTLPPFTPVPAYPA